MRGHFAADMTGQTFGRLVVLSRAGTRKRQAIWLCKCSCGNEHEVAGQYLKSGKSRSCGCLQREDASARFMKHGATTLGNRWPEWGVWRQMINRCTEPSTRGISITGLAGSPSASGGGSVTRARRASSASSPTWAAALRLTSRSTASTMTATTSRATADGRPVRSRRTIAAPGARPSRKLQTTTPINPRRPHSHDQPSDHP